MVDVQLGTALSTAFKLNHEKKSVVFWKELYRGGYQRTASILSPLCRGYRIDALVGLLISLQSLIMKSQIFTTIVPSTGDILDG